MKEYQKIEGGDTSKKQEGELKGQRARKGVQGREQKASDVGECEKTGQEKISCWQNIQKETFKVNAGVRGGVADGQDRGKSIDHRRTRKDRSKGKWGKICSSATARSRATQLKKRNSTSGPGAINSSGKQKMANVKRGGARKIASHTTEDTSSSKEGAFGGGAN